MKTIQGPAIFLAQFAGDTAPFNTLDGIAGWAAGLGYKGVQIPSWDARLFDLKKAAGSKTYCDEVKGTLAGGLPALWRRGHRAAACHPGIAAARAPTGRDRRIARRRERFASGHHRAPNCIARPADCAGHGFARAPRAD